MKKEKKMRKVIDLIEGALDDMAATGDKYGMHEINMMLSELYAAADTRRHAMKARLDGNARTTTIFEVRAAEGMNRARDRARMLDDGAWVKPWVDPKEGS